MQKLQAKSKEKKYLFENITPNTRETNAVSMLPQNTKKISTYDKLTFKNPTPQERISSHQTIGMDANTIC